MAKRMGRPRLENANDLKLSIRINPEILQKLEAYCKAHGKSKGEAVRAGLLMLFEAAEKKTK